MIGGRIKRFKIIIIGFDFRTVNFNKAHRNKEVLDFASDLRKRMQIAGFRFFIDRNVYLFGVQTYFQLFFMQSVELFSEKSFDSDARVVYHFAECRTVGGGNIAHAFHKFGKFSAFTEQRYAQIV